MDLAHETARNLKKNQIRFQNLSFYRAFGKKLKL